MSSSETTQIPQLLRYARLHGLASETEPPRELPVGDNCKLTPEPGSLREQQFKEIENRYQELYTRFCKGLNEQKLDISMTAKDLVASVLKEERVDGRIEWEDILPRAPLTGSQDDLLFVTKKDEDKHMAKKQKVSRT
ncbi:hypothetical protein N7481_005099 [Penicillium waksmanii]|uniref:uncharacterized protein n=1 Tax=Penicillium waksmanii TaxID=69791 RepID=UPI002549A92A|nr:uncharacterized protein N7481_005099 [Penicillium waksmanii]KAJ5983000.1 hypothetical protein N7481_005099 [Penicillium waksmanii]